MSRVALVDRGALRAAKDCSVCAVDGCEQLATQGRYCVRCYEELRALEAMAASRKHTDWTTISYGAFVLAGGAYLAREMMPFFVDCLRLWFGGL